MWVWVWVCVCVCMYVCVCVCVCVCDAHRGLPVACPRRVLDEQRVVVRGDGHATVADSVHPDARAGGVAVNGQHAGIRRKVPLCA